MPAGRGSEGHQSLRSHAPHHQLTIFPRPGPGVSSHLEHLNHLNKLTRPFLDARQFYTYIFPLVRYFCFVFVARQSLLAGLHATKKLYRKIFDKRINSFAGADLQGTVP
jgi:hypothetical protein